MIDSPLTRRVRIFLTAAENDVFATSLAQGPARLTSASPSPSSSRPVCGPPLDHVSSLLAACKTRARRPTLVVSSRGASPPHGPVSCPSRASIAAAPARSSVPLGSRARNPAVCEAVTPLRRVRRAGPAGRSNGGDARDRRAARASLFPNHRRASDRPPASPPPIADVPRALPVQRPATRHIVRHHGHARGRLRHDQGVVPRGRLVRGPEVLEEEHAARVRVPGRGERHHLQLQPAGGAEAARAHKTDPQPGVVRQLP